MDLNPSTVPSTSQLFAVLHDKSIFINRFAWRKALYFSRGLKLRVPILSIKEGIIKASLNESGCHFLRIPWHILGKHSPNTMLKGNPRKFKDWRYKYCSHYFWWGFMEIFLWSTHEIIGIFIRIRFKLCEMDGSAKWGECMQIYFDSLIWIWIQWFVSKYNILQYLNGA